MTRVVCNGCCFILCFCCLKNWGCGMRPKGLFWFWICWMNIVCFYIIIIHQYFSFHPCSGKWFVLLFRRTVHACICNCASFMSNWISSVRVGHELQKHPSLFVIHRGKSFRWQEEEEMTGFSAFLGELFHTKQSSDSSFKMPEAASDYGL